MQFWERGFLLPGRLLSADQIVGLQECFARIREQRRQEGRELNLLDYASGAHYGKTEVKASNAGQLGLLVNLWMIDEAFREVSLNPVLGHWAAQLLGVSRVRLLSDQAFYKDPGVGGRLVWHQDSAVLPLAQPTMLSAWVALDNVTAASGAMEMAVGSHLLGERLPVDQTATDKAAGEAYMADARPSTVKPMEDPEQLGMEIVTIELEPGEVSLHHSQTWHASGPNHSDRPRRGFVPRFVPDGAIWLGSRRHPFYYSDDEVGISIGEPLAGKYFPVVPG
jgi:hypothetical protein